MHGSLNARGCQVSKPALNFLGIALCLLCALSSRARAQTYTCLSDTSETAQVLRDYIIRLVTGTDTATVRTRNAYQLPAVAASKVSVVTTASICRTAGPAYHAAVTPPGTPQHSRTLVLIKVSNTRYIVLDSNELTGEFENHIIFDSNWH